MQSGLVETMQTANSGQKELEHEIEIEEIKSNIELFKKSGFSINEIKDTLLDMPSYRHLKSTIIELLGE